MYMKSTCDFKIKKIMLNLWLFYIQNNYDKKGKQKGLLKAFLTLLLFIGNLLTILHSNIIVVHVTTTLESN